MTRYLFSHSLMKITCFHLYNFYDNQHDIFYIFYTFFQYHLSQYLFYYIKIQNFHDTFLFQSKIHF